MEEERFVAAARNSVKEKGKQKDETPPGCWPVGVRTGSLGRCCARSLAVKWNIEISCSQPRPMPTPWVKNSWKSYRRKTMRKKNQRQDRAENPLIEHKIEERERDGHVACHTSALALAMTDEACQEDRSSSLL